LGPGDIQGGNHSSDIGVTQVWRERQS
jgi:hypothetical protein